MRIVLLGEQATGKSSLLVSLYGALLHRRAGEMRIIRTDDDVEFLSRGLEALGRFESVRRTEADADARVSLAVSHGSATVAVEMPDRSGDQLRNMIDTRLWDPQLQRHVAAADAAMLFLRADWLLDETAATMQPDPFEQALHLDGEDVTQDAGAQPGDTEPPEVLLWTSPLPEARVSASGVDSPSPTEDDAIADPSARPPDTDGAESPGGRETGGDADTGSAVTEAPGEPASWAPSTRMPVDVRAIDLLQELLEERATRLPLAVIISAWDRAAGATPEAWLAEQVPLLDQFLASNDWPAPPRTVRGLGTGRGLRRARRHRGLQLGEDPWDRAYLDAARTGCSARSPRRSNG